MKLFKNMALALAAFLAVGCVQEYMELDPNQVPQASDLNVTITVDQQTNYVTFSCDNKGVVPMWLFGEEKIDGKANKKYAYTGNGVQLRIRDAGEHSVEVKAYNAHGVSVGSVVKTFTLENTYRDPFDPSKYITFFAGSSEKVWEWNSTVKGHFGCGEPGTDGTNWWSAGANEKADWGLYDDRLTFTSDGKYTYNPGEGGMVYVNKDSGYGTEYNTNDGNDYMVPIEAFTTTYSFENAWNDAGIEEVYLVLPADANLSYIPNPDAMADPRYRVLEGTNTKKLALVHDNGAISWKYEFVVEGSVKPEDPVPGPGEVVFDPNSDRNLWKNAVMDVSFWFADEGWAQIANPQYTAEGNTHTIVIPDGIGSQRWQGQMVFNNTGIVTSAEKTYDFQLVLNSTADHGGVTIKLTQQDDDNVFFFEDQHKVTAYEDYKYQVKGVKGVDLSNAKLVLDFGGAVPGSTVVIKDIVLQEHIEGGSGPAPFDPAEADNLWNNAAMDVSYWFADEGWTQIANPEHTVNGKNHTIVLPEGMGSQRWQGQFVFNNTGIVTSADKTYDFQLVLVSTADHPGITIKLTQQDDDNVFFFEDQHKVTAYEEYKYQVYGVQGVDLSNAKLVLDFGGGVPGSTVEIKDIVLREAKTVSGGGSGEITFDPDAADNLWKNAVTTDHHFWFANNDWGEIAPATVTSEGGTHTFVLPDEIGSQQWQGQFFFQNTGLSSSADKTYDFYCVLNSTADHAGVTVKLCAQDDDGAIITDGRYALSAYEDFELKVTGVPGIDCANLKLVFDFGGGQGGSTVVVKDIIFREAQTPSTGGGGSNEPVFDPNAADNLWNNAVTTDHHFWFANNDWAAIENAAVTSNGNYHEFVLPEGIGSQQWQGQFFFQNTGLSSEAAKTYDFYCVLNSTADHAGVTVKLCAQDDDGAIITDGRYALSAYEDFELKVVGAQGIDCANLKLVLDFGGGQGGSTVVVKDIIFREHK